MTSSLSKVLDRTQDAILLQKLLCNLNVGAVHWFNGQTTERNNHVRAQIHGLAEACCWRRETGTVNKQQLLSRPDSA